MKKIGVALIVVFSIITVQAWADIVETTSGSIYRGTITKMDENEVILKTATGISRIPRSQVRAFQSEPPPGTSATSGTSPSTQPSDTQKKTASILGESAREALRALKKLEARCQAGISYKDYGPALGEAKFEVNLFLESPEAKEKVLLAVKFERCLADHQLARSVWELYLVTLQHGHTRQGIYPVEYARRLESSFPEMREVINNSPVRDKKFILLSEVLGVIWKEAGKVLQEAYEDMK